MPWGLRARLDGACGSWCCCSCRQRVDIGDGVLVPSSSATSEGTAADGQARLGCDASQVIELRQRVAMRDKLVWSWFRTKLAVLNVFISFPNRGSRVYSTVGYCFSHGHGGGSPLAIVVALKEP